MAGQAVRNFTDFWNSTGPFIASGPDELINDAAYRSWTLRYFLKGKKFSDVSQGGQRIEDELLLTDKATAETYKPGATGAPTQPQVLSKIYQNWRFVRDSKAWQDEILRLQASGSTKERRFQVYKRLATSLDQSLWTSMLNKLEQLLWASPHGQQAQMETETGQEPMSLPGVFSEDTTLNAPSTSSTANTTAWTTIHGQNPATESNWRNPVTRYKYTDPLDTTATLAGLFDAFEKMWMYLSWQTPGKEDQHFDEVDPSMCAIFCSMNGKMFYQSLCRLSNDSFARANNDPSYSGVNFHGVPIQDVEILNDAALYWNGTNWGTEASATLTNGGTWATSQWTRGPRYWWVNSRFTRMWFHDEMFFDSLGPDGHINQPWAKAVWRRVCGNLLCRSRKKGGGIVGPGGVANAA